MFDIGFSEIVVIGVVALVAIGPEKLPKTARTLGHLFGRLQRYVNEVKSDISREMELDQLRQIQQDVKTAAEDLKQSVQSAATSIQTSAKEIGNDLHATANAASEALHHTTEAAATAEAAASVPDAAVPSALAAPAGVVATAGLFDPPVPVEPPRQAALPASTRSDGRTVGAAVAALLRGAGAGGCRRAPLLIATQHE